MHRLEDCRVCYRTMPALRIREHTLEAHIPAVFSSNPAERENIPTMQACRLRLTWWSLLLLSAGRTNDEDTRRRVVERAVARTPWNLAVSPYVLQEVQEYARAKNMEVPTSQEIRRWPHLQTLAWQVAAAAVVEVTPEQEKETLRAFEGVLRQRLASDTPSVSLTPSQPPPLPPTSNERSGARADPRPVARAETRPIERADPRPVVRAETRPIARADPRLVARAETRPIERADPRPVVRAESRPSSSTQPGPVPQFAHIRAGLEALSHRSWADIVQAHQPQLMAVINSDQRCHRHKAFMQGLARHRQQDLDEYLITANVPEDTRTFLIKVLREPPFEQPLKELLGGHAGTIRNYAYRVLLPLLLVRHVALRHNMTEDRAQEVLCQIAWEMDPDEPQPSSSSGSRREYYPSSRAGRNYK